MLSDFQMACERARARAGEENWLRLSGREWSNAIFDAMSELDRDWNASDRMTSKRDSINSQCDARSSLVRLRLFGPMTAWTVSYGNRLLLGPGECQASCRS